MKKMRIVLAEDDTILSKVIIEELKGAGYDVTHVKDGEDAVSTVTKKMPDLALFDVLMPKMTGMEALEELKGNPITKDVPVIMLTMLSSDDDIKKALKLGASDYIVKSQHAVGEIVEKVNEFFGVESHPEAHSSKQESSEEE